VVIVPLGHEHFSVHRLPWVTIAIAVVCLALQVRASILEPPIEAELGRLVAERGQLETELLQNQLLAGGTKLPGMGVELDLSGLSQAMGGEPAKPEEKASAAARAERERERLAREIAALDVQIAETLETMPTRQLGYRPATDGVMAMLTSAFAHGGWLHLLGNLLFLYLVGLNMEDRWGSARFAAFYAAGALGAALAFKLWHPAGTLPLVGASGAIAAVMGAFAVCFAATRIRFFYAYWIWLRPRWGTFHAPAWLALPLWFVEQLVMSLFEVDSGFSTAYSAHVGGFVLGLAIAALLRLTGTDRKLADRAAFSAAPGDQWSEEPEYADAEGLLRDGHRGPALAKLESLLARTPDHAAGRELALRVAEELDDDRLRSHAASTFAHWLRTNRPERVLVTYRALRERRPALAFDESVLRSVLTAAGRSDVEPRAAVDAAGELMRRFPDSALIPRALWTAAEAQARGGRADLARQTLEHIIARFPMDPIAEQARRKLSGRSLPPRAVSNPPSSR
jgi:membrane associated rhomboid family serine protease